MRMAREKLKLAGRVALGLLIGLIIGLLGWVADVRARGHDIDEALRGRVEDGLNSFLGLAALGALCGTGVGLLWGLVVLAKDPAERSE
jgi:hypothetical protein